MTLLAHLLATFAFGTFCSRSPACESWMQEHARKEARKAKEAWLRGRS